MIIELDYQLSGLLFSWGQALPGTAVVFLATWLIWVLAGYVLFLGFALPRRQRLVLWLRALASLVLVFAVNTVITWLYWRYRPFVTFDFTPLVNPLFLDQSFPSSHAASSWALAGSVWIHNKKSGLVALGGAVLVSLGRVLSGVHYLSDIIVGAAVGLIVAWLVVKISFKIPPIRRQQQQ